MSASKSLPAVPNVLRSWQHLYATQPGLVLPDTLPLTPSGTTYTMAQELKFLDQQHFAVGRWDGSLSIFRFTEAASSGPLMSTVANTPSAEGVQMITLIGGDGSRVATSNDEESAIIWQRGPAGWQNLVEIQKLQFNPDFGVANSGLSFVDQAQQRVYFVIGHANGYLSLWQAANTSSAKFAMYACLNLRSSKPTNPWSLHNIRGIAMLANQQTANPLHHIATGSEDGDICIVRVEDAAVVSRTVYNPLAQRGINSISAKGLQLLVANCAVGAQDYNLWAYHIDPQDWSVQCTDQARLVVDQSLAQVFDFDVIWGQYSAGPCWYAATEEGYLWMGTCDAAGKLQIIGRQAVTAKLGAAIDQNSNGDLALAAYDVYEFEVGQS